MKNFLVVIGIPTYKRPLGLRRLLDSIAALEVPAGLQVRVLVADNEGTEGAGMAVVAEMNKLGYALPIGGVGVSERGISQNRNALLQEGFDTLAADALVMVDDDMWLAPEWLREVWAMQQRTGAMVVSGQMVPVFPADAPKWAPGLGVYQNVRQLQEGVVPLLNATGNVLMMRAVWEVTPQVTFNPALGLTGGEDADYFLGLQARGGTFAYAPAAVSYEEYMGVRVTRKWVMRRAFRIGTETTQHLFKQQAHFVIHVVSVMKCLGALVMGSTLLMILWWLPQYQMKTVNLVVRMVGQLAGYSQIKVVEYAVPHAE